MDNEKGKLSEDKDTAKLAKAIAEATPTESQTEDFKESVQKATEQVAAEVAAWKEFWKEWIPGGLRRRKRYRTKGHGARRVERRHKNKVARASRKRNRPHKKKRR